MIPQPHHYITPVWSLAPANRTLGLQFCIANENIAEINGDAKFLHACNIGLVLLFYYYSSIFKERRVKLNTIPAPVPSAEGFI